MFFDAMLASIKMPAAALCLSSIPRCVQAANNSPVQVQLSPSKSKPAGFISRLCGSKRESEDASVPGKKWVQVFDHNGIK